MLISIIPVRGGSQGLPNKNLRTVGGISLTERAVKFATKFSDRVLVSSDSSEILESIKHLNCEPVVRPSDISTSFSSSEQAISHALNYSQILGTSEKSGIVIALVQATSPFQDSKAFNLARELIYSRKADSSFSSVEDHSFRWELKNNSSWEPVNHAREKRLMRQELPFRVRETGAFYMMTLDEYQKCKTRFAGIIQPVITDSRFAIDIDSEEDLKEANFRSRYIDPELEYLKH